MAVARGWVSRSSDSGASAPTDSSAHGLDPIRVRRVLDYIAANIKDDITLVKLAAVAGYSPFHFTRKFALAMGISPHRYISRMRLENAMAELAVDRLPLAEVALNAQFSRHRQARAVKTSASMGKTEPRTHAYLSRSTTEGADD